MPFGEVFVEERNASWSTPYKFNGKEQDEETGLSYYGARYYDPRTSVWLSVDPLAEGKLNVSGYVYCFNNPINYIDPDGRWEFSTDGKSIVAEKGDNAQTLAKFNNSNYSEALNQLKSQGYSTQRKNGKDVLNLNIGDNIKLDVEVPNAHIRSRMGEAVDKSNNPSTEANDNTGGIHEEGGYYGRNANGQEVAIDANPGQAYKKGAKGLSIYTTEPSDKYKNQMKWRGKDQIDGTYHVHPVGNKSVKFLQSPTPADFVNSQTRFINGVTGNNYVLSPKVNSVYVYKNGILLKQYPLDKFTNK